MYTIRHYWARLRWSKRPPFVIARTVARLAVVLAVAVIVLDVLGVATPHALLELVQGR